MTYESKIVSRRHWSLSMPVSYRAQASDRHRMWSTLATSELWNHLVKFADDTHLIVPAKSVYSRSTEIKSIETWAVTNNLSPNCTKSKEIIFIDSRRKRQFVVPPSLPEIVRVTSVKILEVSITDSLSASGHVRGVISNSAQTLYALRVCVLMAWMTWLSKPSLDQLSLPSWCTRLALGADLSRRQTGRELMPSSPQQAMRLLLTRPDNFWRNVQEIWYAAFLPGHWKPKSSPIWFAPPTDSGISEL